MTAALTLGYAFFVLAAACYLLFLTSDPLERVGGRLGQLLRLPEDVSASTLQALATSGPEIVMSILVATPFVAKSIFGDLPLDEKASSGCLNMCFSAMDNLVGIGALGMIFMIYRGTVLSNDRVILTTGAKLSLSIYILASVCLALFVHDSVLTVLESQILMGIGIFYVVSQFFVPNLIARFDAARAKAKKAGSAEAKADEEGKREGEEGEEALPLPSTAGGYLKDLGINGFQYLALLFGLVLFVQQCLDATFSLAALGIASIGGVLILITSYVSSFPEFMLSYRYAIKGKKSALLGMLFGSNVIDLAFAGFRSLWLNEDMKVYTTGRYPEYLIVYIWLLPIVAGVCFLALYTKIFRYKHAYLMFAFYLVYIISGFIII
jgi:Ca2+/Na+ antiporter